MNWEKIDDLLGQIYSQAVAIQSAARLLKAGTLAGAGMVEETLTAGQTASIAARSKTKVQALIATMDSLKQELGIP